MNPDAAWLIQHLELEPLEIEGGWFRESYRSNAVCQTPRGERPLATAIFFLLTPETFSELHRLPGDEVIHFYLGDPVQMLHLSARGGVARPVMGSDLAAGQHVQMLVPGMTWQGAMLRDGGQFALLGTTMSPGFSYEDYERGDRKALTRRYSDVADDLMALTRV